MTCKCGCKMYPFYVELQIVAWICPECGERHVDQWECEVNHGK